MKKKKLLLHICCIGCGISVIRSLRAEYEVTLYFYNPNIFPLAEYEKRLEEIRKVSEQEQFQVIIDEYEHKRWLEAIKGLENEPERGARCLICYAERLAASARKARELSYDLFGTTLTISPHKDAVRISALAQNLAAKYGIVYLDRDFKKQDGFKKSCQLSRELGLYRQEYCGCEFSLTQNTKNNTK